ncbi:MAG TPA: sigma-70 family RNA polymerase sigma factor [Acidimicrobiia bacterium]|nr:sigma-70 family RNA polymerase sigma factor [Acidimicrobiia bacterium]
MLDTYPDTVLDDTAIVERITAGDRVALEIAYRRHSPAVMGAAMTVTRDRDAAEDVVQEVFLRLWRNPGRFDRDRGSLRTFLAIDGRGRALDLVRSRRSRRDREDREARLASSDHTAGTEEQAMQTVLSAEIRQVLGRLRPAERDPIALAYFGGQSYREVARLLGVPEGTIKSRIRAGLERLAPMLEELGVAA